MKKLLLTLLPVLALSFAVTAQDTLFVEEFDGGIPDTWTIDEGDPLGGVWQWSATASADSVTFMGERYAANFYGTIGQMNSDTPENGAAMFNSDALDGGEGGSPRTGPLVAPHFSVLTSPSIDCSSQTDNVFLKFHQSYRNFQSSSRVEVSNDGGMTWTDFPVNTDIGVNTWTGGGDIALLDISEVAAGEADVRIRFIWDGDYYFWLIDDIVVVSNIGAEVSIPDYFYLSSVDYARPEAMPIDTFFFQTSVANRGTSPVENLVLRARVLRDLGDDGFETLYEDSTIVQDFPAGASDTIFMEDLIYLPEGELTVGDYLVVYDAFPQDRQDYIGGNNQGSVDFIITENLFSKDDGATGGIRPGAGGDYDVASIYEIGAFPASDSLKFVASSVQVAAGTNDEDGPMDGRQVTVILYKVNDGIEPDLSNFPPSPKDGMEAGMTSIAFAQLEFPAEYDDYSATAPMAATLLPLDPTVDEIVLEPNAQYMVGVSYADDNNVIFQGWSDDRNYLGNLAYLLWIQNEESWFLNGFGADTAPVIRLNMEVLPVQQDNIPLPENAMNIFPNPVTAGNNMNVQVDLEAAQDAMLLVTDVEGKVVSLQNFDQIQQETLQAQTSHLAAGQYFIRLSTNEGTRTMKFTVVR
jgi:hypothetical protein